MRQHFLFIDDAVGTSGDAERYRRLLTGGDLQVTLAAPSREALLVPDDQLAPEGLAGFILDINLRDQVADGKQRFIGTGAGLAQDLRLLQAVGGKDGQRPRPIVRLCATQVFQQYIAGDNSTADVFDLGFDKETIADVAAEARAQIAALPDIYDGVIAAGGEASKANEIIGVTKARYSELHSAFRNAFEQELEKKPHETANFLLNHLLLRPGLLISDELLAVRLGVDRSRSEKKAWSEVVAAFAPAAYSGRGRTGFPRFWMDAVQGLWAGISDRPLFSMSAAERVEALKSARHDGLVAIELAASNLGDRPWAISASERKDLRVPVDLRQAYSLSLPRKAWEDEPVWSLEQAKQQRRSRLLSDAERDRLERRLRQGN